ncbi:hypothetical protein H5410_052014 [Solanum commersonii]|uniref:Uncharacterized protein n=1 Tax=Solanum commersonii TaxID=4109 RepID=A0A9J5X013_SOLCO|nr:hypothetical protein H5410_052014 [Solanum commersonii]
MATSTTGQPPPTGGDRATIEANASPNLNFLAPLRPTQPSAKPIPMKPVAYLHGEPRVIWEEDEVEQMIIKDNLEFAVIGKFS